MNRGMWRILLVLFLTVPMCFAQRASSDEDRLTQIRQQALDNSAVDGYAFQLTDVYGARLSGSPAYRRAAEWASRSLRAVGLDSVVLHSAISKDWSEPGWAYQRYGVRLLEPVFATLTAIPVPYSPPTGGRLAGEPLPFLLPGRSGLSVDEIILRFRGKLKDKILLISDQTRPVADWWKPLLPPPATVTRLKEEDLLLLRQPPPPAPRKPSLPPPPSATPGPARSREQVNKDWQKLFTFLKAEGALAFLNSTIGDSGTMLATGPLGPPGIQPPPPPGFNLAMESYNRILRLMQKQVSVRLEVELESQFFDEKGHTSVLAEIRGTGNASEFVLAGAHLDSWHVGTGATDNGGNCAVLMEAVRILKVLKLPLSRTVRIALWAGHERGTRGSAAYVNELKTRASEKLYLYLNLDSGGGRIRGIQVQERVDLAQVGERWLAPFRPYGQGFVSVRKSLGSDQYSFDREKLPNAVFLQDPLFGARPYHSNMDVFDYLIEDDLKQSAALVAWVLYQASNEP